MSKKMIILLFAAAVSVMIFVIAMKTHQKDITTHNATARYIKEGHTGIACEDAKWLTDIFSQLIDEEITLMKKYEKPFADNNTPVQDEILSAMRREMYLNPSAAQKKFEQWHTEVILFINELYKGSADDIKNAENSVGTDITELYYVVSGVKLDIFSETEVLKTIEERYCSGHIN